MYETSRVIDFFRDLDPFLAVQDSLTEVTDRGKALHKMATTMTERTSAVPKRSCLNAPSTLCMPRLRTSYRLIVLARLVVSRTQVIPRHCTYAGFSLAASEG